MEAFHLSAGCAIVVISIIGLLTHGFILFNFFTHRIHRSSFAIFCASKSFFEATIALCFLLWSAPIAFWGEQSVWSCRLLNNILSSWSAYCSYMSIQLLQIFGPLNRFMAVYFWQNYSLYCGYRQFPFFFLISLSLGATWAIYWRVIGAEFYFQPDILIWAAIPTDPTGVASTELTFKLILLCTAATILIDVATFAKIVYTTKSSSVVNSTDSLRRIKRNNVMFLVAAFGNGLYLMDIFDSTVIATLSDEGWWQFLCNSISWLTISTLDGLVMVTFYDELRRNRKEKKERRSETDNSCGQTDHSNHP